MSNVDYLGARGANAGDYFHELGRLDMRFRCLTTIPSLPSLPSRGFRPEDEEGQSQRNWDGVDCGLYYGVATIKDSVRIEKDPSFFAREEKITTYGPSSNDAYCAGARYHTTVDHQKLEASGVVRGDGS